MATEIINEAVDIIASFKQNKRGGSTARPEIMIWRERRYHIDKIGMRYPAPKGGRYFHRFTFTANGTAFELELDAALLSWQLLRTNDGNTD